MNADNTIFVSALLSDGRVVFTWVSQRDMYEGNTVHGFIDRGGEMIPVTVNAGEIVSCEEQ